MEENKKKNNWDKIANILRIANIVLDIAIIVDIIRSFVKLANDEDN
jgi:hypothetical protein